MPNSSNGIIEEARKEDVKALLVNARRATTAEDRNPTADELYNARNRLEACLNGEGSIELLRVVIDRAIRLAERDADLISRLSDVVEALGVDSERLDNLESMIRENEEVVLVGGSHGEGWCEIGTNRDGFCGSSLRSAIDAAMKGGR